MSDLPRFDKSAMNTMYEGMPDDFKKQSLASFLEQGQALVDVIANAPTQQSDAIEKAFHSMKTMSSMVGAKKLSELCSQGEATESTQEVESIKQSFLAEWKALKSEMQRYLANSN